MANLKVNGLTKIFPSGEAGIYDVSFEAADKEFLVVIGGEQSGKSTLLRTIAGLEEVSEGTIEIGGKDVTEIHPKDRNVAMVFRHDTLYPDLNVFDNMAFGLKQRKAPPALIEARVKAVAKILGLEEVLYRRPKALTSAARQRVALGRAIAREPKLYLFDEPLAGIDDKLRADMLNLIINLQARVEGTFLYCTKNLSEAMTIGTRVIVLKKGLVQQIDTPRNLYDYPANAYVAFFVGAPTINFIKDVTLDREGDGVVAKFAGGKIALPESIIKRFENIESYLLTGDKVWLGIRPEDCSIAADGELCGTLKTSEADGDREFAEIEINGGISMIVGGQSFPEAGAQCSVKLDKDRLHIFDDKTRLTLLARDGGYIKTDKADADFAPKSFEEENEVIERLNPKRPSKKKK